MPAVPQEQRLYGLKGSRLVSPKHGQGLQAELFQDAEADLPDMPIPCDKLAVQLAGLVILDPPLRGPGARCGRHGAVAMAQYLARILWLLLAGVSAWTCCGLIRAGRLCVGCFDARHVVYLNVRVPSCGAPHLSKPVKLRVQFSG